ncbi:hypothetical protein K505DRAFT_349635 [Melanomma pulvis-pyrius CBS 109.77]|uniref:Mitotic checkpoint regulator, MAD2B-interacting-domain-containing protein n=1 Tax=Melanomma pulvis-pyrius CBS 109.77 TaxID=1314802 RepID=A0A6A6XBU0_9PLEO|nr:hypothetical protein K505DRAFT_349635 [Melanomma pulvis-pyrius CBS 109.77]
MNLIAYSDSDDSDTEAQPAPKPAARPAPKPAFQKVVDRTNPGKIRVNLPGASQPKPEKDDLDADAPPAKKARTGGGGFGGFNALLPAPKKPSVDTAGGDASGKRGLGKGLGSGINLKTGAEPAFKREPKMYNDEDQVPLHKEDFRAMLNLPPSKTNAPAAPKVEVVEVNPTSEPKPTTKSRFVPMSIGRGKKRKPTVPRPSIGANAVAKPTASSSTTPSTIEAQRPEPNPRPRVSLFSVSQEEATPAKDLSRGDYQPLLHGVGEQDDAAVPDEAFNEAADSQVAPLAMPLARQRSPAHPQSLTNIASELNLSEAERRQLFGRKGHGPDLSSAKIVDFNTDTEYAHNERLRQQGETVQHNALKSISGTGKNSLKSLISVATTQKDALEEHFATGRRNKREAGNKYGW